MRLTHGQFSQSVLPFAFERSLLPQARLFVAAKAFEVQFYKITLPAVGRKIATRLKSVVRAANLSANNLPLHMMDDR
jgi:hypothetical protein